MNPVIGVITGSFDGFCCGCTTAVTLLVFITISSAGCVLGTSHFPVMSESRNRLTVMGVRISSSAFGTLVYFFSFRGTGGSLRLNPVIGVVSGSFDGFLCCCAATVAFLVFITISSAGCILGFGHGPVMAERRNFTTVVLTRIGLAAFSTFVYFFAFLCTGGFFCSSPTVRVIARSSGDNLTTPNTLGGRLFRETNLSRALRPSGT